MREIERVFEVQLCLTVIENMNCGMEGGEGYHRYFVPHIFGTDPSNVIKNIKEILGKLFLSIVCH